MEARFNFMKAAPGAYAAMLGLEKYLHECGLEQPLLLMVKLRASQINGCAYCLDMHWKDLRASGETEQRMYSLDAWRECPYYTERERAAGHAPDAMYQEVRAQFNEKEICDLSLAVAAINAWNRLVISSRTVPGGYQSQVAKAAH
jgi:AhpD family alkylhydroperoxidase